MNSPDLFYPLLDKLRICATEALSPTPARSLVVPGAAVAWDDCCEGQVWSRLIAIVPANLTGTGSSGLAPSQPCGVLMWQALMGVGVIRCAAVVGDDGIAPPADVLSAEAQQMTQDATAINEAIHCCFAPQVSERTIQIVRWDPLGVEGGCAGGEWQLAVRVDNCRCETAP